MKALTLKQPWAFLVCSGVKDIENRTWKCPEKYIGERVLIHASKDTKSGFWMLNRPQLRYAFSMLSDNGHCALQEGERGAIIGSVRIAGCTINHPSVWAEKTYGGKTVYNLILEDAILFDNPILNVKGKLSFWESGYEIVKCPKCGNYCLHNNSDVGVHGWGNPVCECSKCGYMIQESEFEFVR